MATRDRDLLSETNAIAKQGSEPESKGDAVAASAEHSRDILINMLKDRFERVVDAFLRYRLGTEVDRPAMLDVLFELYEEGLLTKGEVRRRGNLEPEEFYDELRAHRLRTASR